MMTSRLVETVMINVEDFAESFLTCGTCLSGYDNADHAAKLLPCSHTVCRTCLDRILETAGLGAPSFRCPICREGITVPRGGGSAFPPAFIVNQLLDMLANQRRDRVPRCSRHPSEELLFCETCDQVFCSACTEPGGHGTGGARAHNVVTFSVAIKRCSEILLYKAHLVGQQLNDAHEAVIRELDRLDENTNKCVMSLHESFEEVTQLVEQRREELLDLVRVISEDKRRALTEQASLIEAERDVVRRHCDQVNYQADVRSISKGISYLNDKLDKVEGLGAPRENAYLRFERGQDAILPEVRKALNKFGCINTSTTYPPLCTAELEVPTVHLNMEAIVNTVDYHGATRRSGTDPVVAELTEPSGGRSSIPLEVDDRGDGSYRVQMRPRRAGPHTLSIRILDRNIRGSPFALDVASVQKPLWTCRTGFNERPLMQPFAVTHQAGRVLVMDTGNSRIVALDQDSGLPVAQLGEEVMGGQAGTGVAPARDGVGLWLVNWRAKQIYLLDSNTDQIVQRYTSPDFVEPTSLAISPGTGELYIVDNGAGRLFACDPREGSAPPDCSDTPGKLKLRTVRGAGQVKRVSGICVTQRDDIVLAGTDLHCVSREGQSLGDLWQGGGRSQFGGVTCVDGFLLANRTERAHSVVQVLNQPGGTPGDLGYELDLGDILKRPAGITGLPDGRLVMVDLGAHSVHALRYT